MPESPGLSGQSLNYRSQVQLGVMCALESVSIRGPLLFSVGGYTGVGTEEAVFSLLRVPNLPVLSLSEVLFFTSVTSLYKG